MAAQKAQLLAGQFRRSEADDPDTFIASWTLVMQDFPPMVLDYVCHPAKGLAIHGNWLPTVFEVREACIAHFSYLLAKWHLEQLPPERRLRFDSAKKQDGDIDMIPSRRLTREELKAKYGPNYGLNPDAEVVPRRLVSPVTPQMTKDQIIKHYREHDLARKPKQEKYHYYEKEEGCERVVADTEPTGGRFGEEEQGQADGGIEATAAAGELAASGRRRREKIREEE